MCHNPEAIKAAVMDKAYMVQLVQVQQRRGAQGGQIFSSVLTLNDESITMNVDDTKSTNKIKSSVNGSFNSNFSGYHFYNHTSENVMF